MESRKSYYRFDVKSRVILQSVGFELNSPISLDQYTTRFNIQLDSLIFKRGIVGNPVVEGGSDRCSYSFDERNFIQAVDILATRKNTFDHESWHKFKSSHDYHLILQVLRESNERAKSGKQLITSLGVIQVTPKRPGRRGRKQTRHHKVDNI